MTAESHLISGRWLEADVHDSEGGNSASMHIHRRILRGYDPAKGTVALSKEGSRRLATELQTFDKEFTLGELSADSFLKLGWKLRETCPLSKIF